MTDIAVPIIAILAVYIALFITSPLIALLHELGHAFAYLILTKPNHIDVFVGSYGNEKNSYSFKLGRLSLHFKYSFPFIWGVGLCKSDTIESTPWKYIIILLAGPIFTLVMAIVFGLLAFHFDANGQLRMFCVALILFSFISLLTNLAPRTLNRSTANYLESDGRQIAFTLKYWKVYPQYLSILDSIQKERFEVALFKIDNLLKNNKPHERLLRYQIACNIALKRYETVIELTQQLNRFVYLTKVDYMNRGCAYSLLDKHELAIKDYYIVIKADATNPIVFNNLGYGLIETGDYKKAEKVLKKSISLNRDLSYANSNLGYLKILTGNFEQAKIVLDKAQELDPAEPHNYKYLGIYHLRTMNLEEAQTNFHKCLELDSSIDLKKYLDEIELLNKRDKVAL
ncbi:tetratricopeptide repeat protein [Mucilaginibacter agri]|uniref:Tetratricopeptide repeat protein n=1 Tax=Mucilaginibacter agri TaxID=2695265 RepID=A0A966DWG9_9SPHI|nr:tetratricopeptide repeat protein [Mucilaginibacter agri]NCD71394.1 tetratricopeptide repeat protein [Mucilaginibacter agri]